MLCGAAVALHVVREVAEYSARLDHSGGCGEGLQRPEVVLFSPANKDVHGLDRTGIVLEGQRSQAR
jgi:hypothetical protein